MSAQISTLRFQAMNTSVELQLTHRPADQEAVRSELTMMREWFVSCERIFSRFDPESELSRLNRSEGKPMLVSDELYDVLALAEQHRLATQGWFQIGILPALEAAGYDRSYDLLGQSAGGAGPVWTRLSPCEGATVRLDPAMRSARLAIPGRGVDLGGIAKSWTVMQAGRWLARHATASAGLVNAGGDAWVWQHRAMELPVRMSVADPLREEQDIATLLMHGGGIATSNVVGRRWGAPGSERHHLIDPHSSLPSTSDVIQATVVGPDAIDCEIWAKTLCLAGSDWTTARMREQAPAYEALVVASDGSIRLHRSLQSLHKGDAATRWITLTEPFAEAGDRLTGRSWSW